MTTETAMQEYLDSLSQVPGSILYRDTYIWKALPPGVQGDILTLDTTLRPTWTENPNYWPALMQFNSITTYYYINPLSVSGNNLTWICRLTMPPAAEAKQIFQINIGSTERFRAYIDPPGHVRIYGNTTGSNRYLDLRSLQTVNDQTNHIIWCQYTGSTGALEFTIDGNPADDQTYSLRHLNPASLPASSTAEAWVGRTPGGLRYFEGAIGYHGFSLTNTPNQADFITNTAHPKPLNESAWTEWGTRPLIWHESGQWDHHKGSAPPFSENGGIKIADATLWS